MKKKNHTPEQIVTKLRNVEAARRETAEQLAASFCQRYRESYPKAVAALARGLDQALTYTVFHS